MTSARRNLLWPVVILAVGVVWLLVALEAVPQAVGDLLVRAWPALLVLAGLELLLSRRRLPGLGRRIPISSIILLVMLAALGVIIALAYQKQGRAVRRDNTQAFDQVLPEDMRRLEVVAALDRTAFSAGPAGEQGARALEATYQGSRSHDVAMDWAVQPGAGALSITETSTESIPRLEDYGRATLDLALPTKTSITLLRLVSEAGNGTLDLESLQIERVEVALADGSLVITLPAGEALSGRLTVRGGSVELRVPPQVALTVTLAEGSGEPSYDYDDLKYDLLRDGTLKLKNATEFQVGLTVWLESGAALRVIDLD